MSYKNQVSFLNNENIIVLWEIIEEYINDKPKQLQENILKVFQNNLQPFYKNEIIANSTLIQMNKKYILMMIQYLQKNIGQMAQNVEKMAQNVGQNTTSNMLITNEEIQTNRIQLFERDLNSRQEEFANSMSINKPPVPNFSIKIEDKPIEMDKTIKQMIAQRNYDIEMINKNTEHVKGNIKDKINKDFINEVDFHENTSTSEKKTLKIYEPSLSDEIYKNQIIDLNKHISWKDELDINKTNIDEIGINIFEKLKKVDLNKDVLIMQNNINYLNEKIIDMDENIKKILFKLNKIE